MSRERAELLLSSKIVLYSGDVREIVIWKVPISEHFPMGVKYRLVLVDPIWKKTLLLFENRTSEGNHISMINGQECSYDFISVKSLIEDFLLMESKLEKKNESNEN
jgi:hypothetical protein